MSRYNKKKAHYEKLLKDVQSGKVAKRAAYLASCTDIKPHEPSEYRRKRIRAVVNDNKLPVSPHAQTGVDPVMYGDGKEQQ